MSIRSSLKILLVSCSILLSIAAIGARMVLQPEIRCAITCMLQYRCYPYYHPDNEVVYAIEDGVCKVFANGCVFSSNNCQRQNQCLPTLESIPRKACLRRCPVCDDTEKKPVCATFTPSNDEANTYGIKYKVQYPNKCEADRAACLSGIPYAFVEPGFCLSVLSNSEIENL